MKPHSACIATTFQQYLKTTVISYSKGIPREILLLFY